MKPRSSSSTMKCMAAGIICLFSAQITYAASIKLSARGYSGTDDTRVFQQVLNDAKYDTVFVDRQNGPWVIAPVTITRDNLTIVFEKGAVVQAKRGAFPGKYDGLFLFDGVKNLKLIGNGATLKMNREEYTDGQWRMNIKLMDVKKALIDNLVLDGSGGDGVYVGTNNKANNYCSDIKIQRCIIRNQKRQGISVISVKGLLVKDCTITGTAGAPPSAGIDFEPNSSNQYLDNCVVENCVIKGNRGPGISISPLNLKDHSATVGITVRNSEISGNSSAGISFNNREGNKVTGNVLVENSKIQDNQKEGVIYREVAGYQTTFRKVDFIDNAKEKNVTSSVLFRSDRKGGSAAATRAGANATRNAFSSASTADRKSTAGNTRLSFEGCSIKNSNGKNPFRVQGQIDDLDVDGDVKVQGAGAAAATRTGATKHNNTGIIKVKYNQ